MCVSAEKDSCLLVYILTPCVPTSSVLQLQPQLRHKNGIRIKTMFSLCLKGQHIVQIVQLLVFKKARNEVVGDSRGMALTIRTLYCHGEGVQGILSWPSNQWHVPKRWKGLSRRVLFVGMIVVCFDVGGGERGCSSLEEIPSQ